jgi:hypothetical protein
MNWCSDCLSRTRSEHQRSQGTLLELRRKGTSAETPKSDSELSKRVAAYDKHDPEDILINALIEGIRQSNPPAEASQKKSGVEIIDKSGNPNHGEHGRFASDGITGGSSADDTHSGPKDTKPH